MTTMPMSDEYTPTLDGIRERAIRGGRALALASGEAPAQAAEYGEQFDRFLAQVRREAKVEALRELEMQFFQEGDATFDGFGASHWVTVERGRIEQDGASDAY